MPDSYQDETPTSGCCAQGSECVQNVRLACIQLQLRRLGQDDARVLDLLRAVHSIMGDAAAGAVLQRGASTLHAVEPGVPFAVLCDAGSRISRAFRLPLCCQRCIQVHARMQVLSKTCMCQALLLERAR